MFLINTCYDISDIAAPIQHSRFLPSCRRLKVILRPRMKTITAVAVILAAGLAGCGPQMTLGDRCVADGYEPGTALFLDCVNSRRQAMLSLLGQMQQQQQQNYQQQMQFYQRPMPVYQNPTINCSSNRFGSSVYTSCN
jgi:hypothetical protein